MATKTIKVVIKTSSDTKGVSNASSALGKFASGLSGVLTVAAGNLVSAAVSSLGNFFSSIGKQALQSVGNIQQLEISLEGLLTQSLMYEKVNEVRQVAVDLTEDETRKLTELSAKLDIQNAKLKEQEQRVWEMTNQWTDQGLATETAKAKLEQMRLEIQNTEGQISELTAKQGSYATVTESSWQQTMNFADASAEAKIQTQDLLKYIQQLSVVSPFETSQVELIARIGLVSGLSTEQVKEFTKAFLDYSAVQGIASSDIAFAAEQFLQLKRMMHISLIDLRQLNRLGIDVAKILGVKMGMSVDEFNQKVKQSPELMDELIASFIEFSGETTQGAAERMTTTVTGMMSTLQDIIEIGSRNLFRPIIEAVAPFASDLLGQLGDFVTGDDISAIGQRLADNFMGMFGTALEGNFEPILVTLQEKVTELINTFSESLVSQWPVVNNALLQWSAQFWDWLTEVYVNIPTNLNTLLGNINSYLETGWSVIAPALATWVPKFWDWASEAVAGIGNALGALVSAIYAWALSADGQGQMSEIGNTLGGMLIEGMALGFQNLDEIAEILANLGLGLLAAIPAIGGLLIIVGGQIVAGIIEGILEKLGIDVEPAMISELGNILKGIGENALLIAKVIGLDIVLGIIEGVNSLHRNIETALSDLANSIIDTFKSLLGIRSPSTIFKSFGISLVQGLIEGIKSMLGSIPAAIGELASTIKDTASNALGSIGSLLGFGGDTETPAISGLQFDPSSTVEGFTILQELINSITLSIQNLYLINLPLLIENLNIMLEIFTAVNTSILEQLAITHLNFTNLNLLWQEMYNTTLITLQSTGINALLLLKIHTENLDATIQILILTVAVLTGVLVDAGNTGAQAGKDIEDAMGDAKDALKGLANYVKNEVVEAFRAMESAALAAAAAAGSAGANAQASTGIGFAGGTSALGFMVPPGYPNDSFKIGVQSGERVLVAPRGQSIESLIGSSGGDTYNNYELNVYTQASSSTLIQDFQTLQALTG